MEIRSSIKLPKKASILLRGLLRNKQVQAYHDPDDRDINTKEDDLRRILAAADSLLRSAYTLVSDRSAINLITHQHA